MDLGEYIFMRVAIALFIPLMIAVVSFLFHLIRKGLHTLLHRNNAPKQADPPRPAPQPAVQKPEKPAKKPVPDKGPSVEAPRERTVRLDPLPEPVSFKKNPPRYSSYQLRALSGEHKGKTFPLYEMTSCTIGRNPQCQIRFRPDTPGVSGLHCQVQAFEHTGTYGVELTDLGSTYGTYLSNGTRLTPNQTYFLQEGDTFLLTEGGPAFLIERNCPRI